MCPPSQFSWPPRERAIPRIRTGWPRDTNEGEGRGSFFSPFSSSPLNFNLRFHIPSPPILPRISVNIYCRERYSRKSSSREFAALNDPDHSMELKRQPPLFCSINWTVAFQCLTPSVHTWLLLRRLFTIVAPCCSSMAGSKNRPTNWKIRVKLNDDRCKRSIIGALECARFSSLFILVNWFPGIVIYTRGGFTEKAERVDTYARSAARKPDPDAFVTFREGCYTQFATLSYSNDFLGPFRVYFTDISHWLCITYSRVTGLSYGPIPRRAWSGQTPATKKWITSRDRKNRNVEEAGDTRL